MIVLGGLVAGVAHVFTGPDHLAALIPMAALDRKKAAWTGATWGLGHGVGVVLLGGIGVLARGAIDVEALSGWSEAMVGFLLVFIGLWGIRRGFGLVVHEHAHAHEGGHGHLHVHLPGSDHAAPEAHAGHAHAAFGVGMLHGAAGTGHLLGVLPALALDAPSAAMWLGAYLVGAVAAMGGFGWGVGGLAIRLGPSGLRALVLGAAALSVVVGLAWIGLAWQAGPA